MVASLPFAASSKRSGRGCVWCGCGCGCGCRWCEELSRRASGDDGAVDVGEDVVAHVFGADRGDDGAVGNGHHEGGAVNEHERVAGALAAARPTPSCSRPRVVGSSAIPRRCTRSSACFEKRSGSAPPVGGPRRTRARCPVGRLLEDVGEGRTRSRPALDRGTPTFDRPGPPAGRSAGSRRGPRPVRLAHPAARG